MNRLRGQIKDKRVGALVKAFLKSGVMGSWKIAYGGYTLSGASSVAVTRYRYRGNKIHSPWATTPAAARAAVDHRARHMESPVP
ncbi:hypothetical protein ACIRRA_28400 [Nocardia sp. NPDC101769]|uniref:hypothetical protein n=1 Tax=Nocardia sp. NPDC101769 TaxID=3364333 RepID=UPI00380248C9